MSTPAEPASSYLETSFLTSDDLPSHLAHSKVFLLHDHLLLFYSIQAESVFFDLQLQSIVERKTLFFGAHPDQDFSVVDQRYLIALGKGHPSVALDLLEDTSVPAPPLVLTQSATPIVTPTGGLYLVGGKDPERRSIVRSVQYTQLRRMGWWRSLPPLQHRRRYAGGVYVPTLATHKLVVVGGEFFNGSEYAECAHTEVFDGFGWTVGPRLQVARRFPMVVVIGNTVVVVGGRHQGRAVQTVEAWSMEQQQSGGLLPEAFVEIGKYHASSRDLAAVAIGSEVYIVKGGERGVKIEKIVLQGLEEMILTHGGTRQETLTTSNHQEQQLLQQFPQPPPLSPLSPRSFGGITATTDQAIARDLELDSLIDDIRNCSMLPKRRYSLTKAEAAAQCSFLPVPPARPNLSLSTTVASRVQELQSYICKLDDLKQDYAKAVKQAMEQRLAIYNQDIQIIQQHAKAWNNDTRRLQQEARLELEQQQTLKKANVNFLVKADEDDYEDDIPSQLRCPITLNLMTDPVVAADGNTYERSALVEWFTQQQGKKLASPLTGAKLESKRFYPVHTLKSLCQQFAKEQQIREEEQAKSEEETEEKTEEIELEKQEQNEKQDEEKEEQQEDSSVKST